MILWWCPNIPCLSLCKDHISSTPRLQLQNETHGRTSSHPRDSLMRRSITLRIRVARTHTPFLTLIISPLSTTSTVNYPRLHSSLPSYTTSLVIFRHSRPPALKTVKIIRNFRYVVLNAPPPLPTPIQNILVPTISFLCQPLRLNATTLRLT
ncbi:hypothetical protein EV702DRAFT_784482 [Suillus placidus]|uniref:Uncharacterized protein n=2 Tax=Suillus placidus TaxID=48579 RepID=A0A9P6ZI84_9AGAM|nr:hypothetical protein EV702DRAFT_784482 [Suillus placidus]